MSDEDPDTDSGIYASTVRDLTLLGPLIGQRIVDITQHDVDHYAETGEAFIEFHLESGTTIHWTVGSSRLRVIDGAGEMWDFQTDADSDDEEP